MNDKQAKRLRRGIRRALVKALGEDAHPEWTAYTRGLVSSKRYNTIVNGEVQKGKAVQIRLSHDCPRAIYQRVKWHVQAIRRETGKRRVRSLRDAVGRAIAHSGARTRSVGSDAGTAAV